jgi:HlyD family secretion protein
VILLALLGFGVVRRQAGEAVEVEVETLGRRDLVAIVTASGEVQPQRSVDVHANVNGTIERVAVREGETVEEGQFLLQIDPIPAEAASEAQAALVQAAERDVDATQVELEQARRDLGRARELASRDLLSREELQARESTVARIQAQVRAARARVEQARAGLRSTRHELERVTITAPMAGVISRLDVEEGEFAFSTGLSPTLLLTIADLTSMQAEIEVDETDVVHVRDGQPADVIVDAFPDTVFHGTVTEVGTSPIVVEGEPQEDARDFEVVVTLREALPSPRAGLSATADIETARRPDAVALPIQSLVVREVPRPRLQEAPPDTLERGEETEGAFVVEEGIARFVPVEVGITGDRFFEVTAGLRPGAHVVSGSYEALRDLEDGDRVKVVEPDRDRDRGRPDDAASGDEEES